MKIHIASLGCRLNEYEIQAVSTHLQEMGHEIVSRGPADFYIVNSCVVTSRSEQKTRKLISRALRWSPKGNSRVIVTGCLSQGRKREGNLLYLSNDYKHLIPQIIENWEEESSMELTVSRFGFSAPLKASTTRINLKIQDGCDHFCSYCIIPFVRGKPQSKPFNQTIEEFKQLLEGGYREIVLTGVMIGSYEAEGKNLADLLEKLLSLPHSFRIHLSSISPHLVSKKMQELLNHEKMVKHLHLSLQSGSDRILKKMNRRYTRKEALALIASIRSYIPHFNFTTDLIVGFPGETDEDFEDSLDALREGKFSHVHAFRYSPRAGTAASRMTPVVPESVKTQRNKRVIELFQQLKQDYYRNFDGKTSIFLTESQKKGKTLGFNEYYIPIEVEESLPRNQWIPLKTLWEEGSLRMKGQIL